MKVTYSWLKDFVDIRISPQALAHKLTMAGLEVASLEEKGGDFVLDIEITSNRPDWLSVIGIAREVAAITNKKLNLGYRLSVLGSRPNTEHRKPNTENLNLEIKIEDKKDCPFYIAKIIKDVRVASSPDWLKKRLELIGCRSVNNIVDITNYVLFTWGEPLHAFDLDKMLSRASGSNGQGLKIIIRRARNEEEIVTIDDVKRVLDENALVIASGSNKEAGFPVALAGIMGGKNTEVTENTKNILLEAAVFNPVLIRRTRQRLGVQTDSSYRFERGIVSETAENASGEAARLICEIAGGSLALAKDFGSVKTQKRMVKLSRLTVPEKLGVEIKAQEIKRILTGLGFIAKMGKNKNFSIQVPAFRQDIKLEIDLVEEVARIFGYENIPQSLPAFYPQAAAFLSANSLVSVVKNILVGLGLNEVITYSLIDREMLKGMYSGSLGPLEILNPLSKEQELLRPTVIPSLLKCVAYNLNQKQEQVCVFEIANSFFPANRESPKEELVLGVALCGIKSLLLNQGSLKERLGLLHLKGILELFFQRLGIKGYSFNAADTSNEIAVCAGKEKIGIMQTMQKNVLDNFDVKNKNVVMAEINLNKLFSYADLKKKFVRIPLYPGILRDISIIVKEDIKVEDILSTIKEKGTDLLREVKVVDYYRGKQIPVGFRGLTISCLYRSDERTLTDAEINPIHSLSWEALVSKFSAAIR